MRKDAQDSAVGIPDRHSFGDVEKLPVDELMNYVVQEHDAYRAGKHYDMRFGPDQLHSWAVPKGMPVSGERRLAIQQPLHEGQYADFEGDIPEGQYGAGTVKTHDKGTVLITKASPGQVHFVVTHRGIPERFALIHTKGKDWILMNTTPQTSDVHKYHQKVHYKKIPEDQVEKVLDGSYAVSAKIDGAAALFHVLKDKIEAISYRTDKEGKPIVHTHRIPGLTSLHLPKDLHGTILRGELYAERGGRALPPQEVGGLLNASVENSRRKQKLDKIKMRAAIFRVLKDRNEVVDPKGPYNLQRVKDIVSQLPSDVFNVPPTETDPIKARKLYEAIRSGKLPLTSEGIVATPLAGGVPSKIKFLQEHDVPVSGIFPAVTKSGPPRAGGFEYRTDGGTARVGTGFTHETLRDMLENPDKYIGRMARVKTQGRFPSGKLRAPSFIALHEDIPQKAASMVRTQTASSIMTPPNMGKAFSLEIPDVWKFIDETPGEEIDFDVETYRPAVELNPWRARSIKEIISDYLAGTDKLTHSKRMRSADDRPISVVKLPEGVEGERPGMDYYILDGYHRLAKAIAEGKKDKIRALVHDFTWDELDIDPLQIEDFIYGLENYPELRPSPERIAMLRAIRGGSPEIKEMLKIMEEGHGVLTQEDRIVALKDKLKYLFPGRGATKEGSADAEKDKEWIGVDLDGTLAKYEQWEGPSAIGNPIDKMVKRVKRWIAEGKTVKIFTARMAGDDGTARRAIRKWCKDHIGQELEVTNRKDPHCVQIWDDRAVSVEKNTGTKKAEESSDEKDTRKVNDWGWAAVRITGSLRSKIAEAASAVADEDLYDEPGYGREDDPHVTVKYGIDAKDVDDVEKAVSGIGPGTGKVSGLSIFDNSFGDDKSKVLKLDITSADLKKLNKAITDNIDCPGDGWPTYHAHVTLAYLKPDADETKYIKDSPLVGQTFDFSSILFRGKGKPTGDEDTIDLVAEEKEAQNVAQEQLVNSIIAKLKEVKALSDKRQYPAKHAKAMALIAKYPDKFVIDSEGDGILGITHQPTGFRFHLPKEVMTGVTLPRLDDPTMLLNMQVTNGKTKKAELLVEFAETKSAEARGLGGRPMMPKNFGMLFKTARSFWMKDCHFDLDAAFLAEDGRILEIQHMTKESFPKTFVPRAGDVINAIELPSGWCKANGVRVGDKLQLVN